MLTSDIRGVLDDIKDLHLKIYTLREKIEMDRIKAAYAAKDEENLKLKAKTDAARDLERTSIEQTYLDPKKNFCLPPLILNNAVKPSVSGNSRKISYFDKEKQTFRNGFLQIPKAKIEVRTEHYVHPSHVRIPVRANNALIPSVLGADYFETLGFEYANEFGVQRLCVSMINDACRCLKLRQARVSTEISIFLMKPDIVLVLRIKGKIIFAVEVKSPDARYGNHNDQVFTSENTSGQIWSYLLAMRSTGIQQPLGAVMTYNKIALASLESFANDAAHAKIVKDVEETLSSNEAPPDRVQQVAEKCEDQITSPIRESVTVSHLLQDANDTKRKAYEEKEVDRVVYYSEVFENGHVFPVLLQAIEMAYQKVESNVATQIPDISHGESLGDRVVFKIGKDYYTWIKTPLYHPTGKKKKAFTANLQDFPDPSSQTFYLLGELGVGSHASVILACNSSCRVCALKSYHVRPSQKSTNQAREKEENEEIESLRDMAKGEADRWRELYQDRFPHVNVVDLAGRPCLVMPYGKQVQNRDAITQKLEEELYRFAEQGYRYKNDDIRWRHVLVDSKGELFLSDLGSLEKHNKETRSPEKLQAIVSKQLTMLMQKKSF